MKALIVVGTRPEAIKMAPVVEAFRLAGEVEPYLCLTGQHTDMVDQVLDVFGLRPDANLNIMTERQEPLDVIAAAMLALRGVIRNIRPDALLVQGDTATAFAGGMAAHLEKVLLGHIEAGLRSHDKWAPFPEEIFRQLVDRMSDLCFAPTAHSRSELMREGIAAEQIFVTGNTVIDAVRRIGEATRMPADPVLASLIGGRERFALFTAHRRESFGAPLRSIFAAVRELAEGESNLRVLYPVHPNPNVRGLAAEMLSGHPRIHLVNPLSYFDLVAALRHCDLVLTDSGGIQEEAPAFGVPVLVLRDTTERPEGVAAGVARLVGSDREGIVNAAREALARRGSRARAGENPYGDGCAAERIADITTARLTGRQRRTADWGAATAPAERRAIAI